MRYEEVLDQVGGFGKYQKCVIIFVLLPALFPCGFLLMNAVYMVATPSDYWCQLPISASSNFSTKSIHALLPIEQRDGLPQHSRCTMYDLNYSSILSSSQIPANFSAPIIPCQFGWIYDQSVYINTLVTEYNLVCDNDLLSAMSFTVYTIGGLFGPFAWGFLADHWGRKPSYFLMIVLQSIFSVATYFSNGYIWFCVCRFFVGSTTSFSYSIPFLLSIELTGTKTRLLVSVICSVGYSISVMILSAIAHPFREWRVLALVSSIPLLAIFGLWKVFPESPRWLLAKGRYDETETFLRKVARINGKQLPKEISDNLPEILRNLHMDEHQKKQSILDLFRTRNLRKKTLILIFLNFCNLGVFMGLNYYAPAFGEDPHLNSFWSGLIELPPLLLGMLCCDRFGRRLCLVLGMFFGAVSSLAASGVPPTSITAVMMLSLLSKFWITLTFMIGELLEEEIFPTIVRGEGHSVTSVCSNIAGCITPFIVRLGHQLLALPLGIFGGLCLIAGFLCMFLPETAGTELPQTLQEGEEVGANMTWSDVLSFKVPHSPYGESAMEGQEPKEKFQLLKRKKKLTEDVKTQIKLAQNGNGR